MTMYLLAKIHPDDFHCFPMGHNEISNILSTEVTTILNSNNSLIAFTDINVWKLSLQVSLHATKCLTNFTLSCLPSQQFPCKISLPSGSVSGFCIFSKLHGPANLIHTGTVCDRFPSLYEAIEESHQSGYAHLDIILPNVLQAAAG